jgi:hypothetical protein
MKGKKAAGGSRLSDADAVKILEVLKGVDSVELKATVPTVAHRATVKGLPLDPVEAQPRQVFFFDTPDLALNKAGLVVRARRFQGGRGDTVVKLRPVVPAELPAEVRKSEAFHVEVDVLPGGFVCSASFKGRSTGQEIRHAVNGDTALRKLFSREQRAFYAEHAPAGLELDALVPLGPTFVLKAAFGTDIAPVRKTEERRMVAEMWLYPDGSRILELSTKCMPSEAFQVAAATRAYLSERGIALSEVQQTKTKAALEFFRAELVGGEGPPMRAARTRAHPVRRSRNASKRASSRRPARRSARA